ncbi:hypothetical protein NK983_31285, partial [Salmonella enterica subsp. enterica serovar Typhimurium]|nr:hypothetical protein [Salmonella enterica subsp. enterica serovar Typhimurium]
MLVNHHQVITRLDAARVDALADLLLADTPVEQWPAEWFDVVDGVQRADVLLSGLAADAPKLPAVLAQSPQALLDE